MLKVNLKKIKAYGDRLDDGVIQLSFTLPVSASPEAKEAAKQYAEKLGLEKVSISTMEPMGEGFSYFVVYGHARHMIDFTKIHVPKIEMPEMDYATLKDYMSSHLSKPIVVIGAATGSDAHTVGIDAIMNMKGFGGDYGLERYPLFKAYNLRSQLTNQQLIEKAIELKADAILISQVVTQRDSHIKNLKELKDLIAKDKRLPKEVIVIIGGPRLDHAAALKLHFDAGFGPGTKPSQVANFIVREYMKRYGIKEKQAKIEVKVKPEAEVRHHEVKHHEARHQDVKHHEVKHHEVRHHKAEVKHHEIKHHEAHHGAHAAAQHNADKASQPEPSATALENSPPQHASHEQQKAHAGEAQRKRRRRGRRGGRRRHKEGKESAAAEGVNPPKV